MMHHRRVIDGGEFTYIGGCGTKTFIDETVPAGSSNVAASGPLDGGGRLGAIAIMPCPVCWMAAKV